LVAAGGKRRRLDLSIVFWEDFWSGYPGLDVEGDEIADAPRRFEGGEDHFPLMDRCGNSSCIGE
jgi:nitrous oxidase accessory protein NosD